MSERTDGTCSRRPHRGRSVIPTIALDTLQLAELPCHASVLLIVLILNPTFIDLE